VKNALIAVNNYDALINPNDLLIYTRIEVVASQWCAAFNHMVFSFSMMSVAFCCATSLVFLGMDSLEHGLV
jgi:hypothetical protein